MALNVTPVNDAPVNTVPGSQATAEDTALPISGVSVADVDGDPLTTTLTVTNGSANVTTGGGAAIGGNGTGTVTISGSAAQINAALTGLTYTNTPDYNGPAQITVATNDGTVTTTEHDWDHGDAGGGHHQRHGDYKRRHRGELQRDHWDRWSDGG